MDVMFSISKPYTDLIFSGKKDLEFRKTIPKHAAPGDMIYIYETKWHHGAGKVIGTAVINNISEIVPYKIGTTFLLPLYVDRYGTKEEKETVKKTYSINLTHYDKSIVLNYLFDDEELDYMKEHDAIQDPFARLNILNIEMFNEKRYKAKMLCQKCDDWATEIGFYNDDCKSTWNYMIELSHPVLFDSNKRMDIDCFRSGGGQILKRPPQSWCYVNQI